MSPTPLDVLVLGAGAAGLFCASRLGQAGLSVAVLDHAKKPAEKVRISGGGRCNFTNLHSTPKNFLSSNPKFCISALKRYKPADFIDLVDRYAIPHHEKTLGQLFCDSSAKDIIGMLLAECAKGQARVKLETQIISVRFTGLYEVETSEGLFKAKQIVVATGGKSIPKMGATGIGYDIAKQFGHTILPTRAGLVPLTFQGELLERCKQLAGVSVDALVSFGKTQFREGLLFTHRGLSGPSILQISSYWQEGAAVTLNLQPGSAEAFERLRQAKKATPRQTASGWLAADLPKALAEDLANAQGLEGRLADLPDKALRRLADSLQSWQILPSGSEGYRTAEVTLGGVDTRELSSQSMESQRQAGLYFIGEVVDVTGHLGGHNFQWAWASAAAAAQGITSRKSARN